MNINKSKNRRENKPVIKLKLRKSITAQTSIYIREDEPKNLGENKEFCTNDQEMTTQIDNICINGKPFKRIKI